MIENETKLVTPLALPKPAWWEIPTKFLRIEKGETWDFPGGSVVKNPPANAGENRFDPWSRKVPHAVEQLSPWATTTEPALYSPRATATEPTRHNYWSPCS